MSLSMFTEKIILAWKDETIFSKRFGTQPLMLHVDHQVWSEQCHRDSQKKSDSNADSLHRQQCLTLFNFGKIMVEQTLSGESSNTLTKFYRLKNRSNFWTFIPQMNSEKSVWLDYRGALLTALSSHSFAWPQLLQNAAARILPNTWKFWTYHVSDIQRNSLLGSQYSTESPLESL